MWASRIGKVGEKITWTQSTARSAPLARRTKPEGSCIQLLAETIQKAEVTVPIATSTVAAKCRRGPTFLQPNSITPRKLASRKKAVSTSKASSGPITGATAAE
jgi:hypothetical protein